MEPSYENQILLTMFIFAPGLALLGVYVVLAAAHFVERAVRGEKATLDAR